ncbi:MAG: 5-methyltetrahydropteroyltriglutamate--homocysteine S-methyltransferase, partial [Hyphomicrobiaceae bacterium]
MTPAQAAGPPFRAEVIGSLLRPRRLKDAARALQQGRIDRASFDAVLEAEIARVIARQEDIGLGVVTDGELARSSWFGFFFEGLDGFRLEPSHFTFKDADGCAFEWATCVAKARIRRHAPIVLPEFERANPHVRRAVVKATMPAPSAFHFFRLGGSVETSAYADITAYFDDLVAIYLAELAELAQAGCRYVQLDEVPIAMLCDPDVRRQAAAEGADPMALLDTYLHALGRIAAGRPAGMTLGLHLCRGNFRGRWMASGGYDAVAEKLFNDAPVDVFFLEYDSERAGDFAPLRFVPSDKRVVLGLLSSKAAALEGQDIVVRRIEEASRILPLDQLGVSTQCGFASVAG